MCIRDSCEIEGPDGTVMGVVGVGFDVNYIQDLLLEYEEQFGVKAYLVDKNGTIQISTKETGFKRVNPVSYTHLGVPL